MIRRVYKIAATVRINCHEEKSVSLDVIPPLNNAERKTSLRVVWGTVSRLRGYDAWVVFNGCFLEMLIAFTCKHLLRAPPVIVFYDVLLERPQGFASRIKAFVCRVLLSSVDVFISVHRATEGYEREYRIPHEKFRYIAFKANNYEVAARYECGDGEYVLAAGASYRDYDTFVEAVRDKEYPVKIALPSIAEAKKHKTSFLPERIPDNVQLVRHDFSKASWYDMLCGARIVVVPIKRGVLQPAGISVCLEAMAFGKPVVISEGPSTLDLIPASAAVIVPPEDSQALSGAISDLWRDKKMRHQISFNGKLYAHALGGENRLVRDILAAVIEEIEARSGCRRVSQR